MKRVMVNLNLETYEELKGLADMLELSVSQLLRTIVVVGLKTSKNLEKRVSDTLAVNMGVSHEKHD